VRRPGQNQHKLRPGLTIYQQMLEFGASLFTGARIAKMAQGRLMAENERPHFSRTAQKVGRRRGIPRARESA